MTNWRIEMKKIINSIIGCFLMGMIIGCGNSQKDEEINLLKEQIAQFNEGKSKETELLKEQIAQLNESKYDKEIKLTNIQIEVALKNGDLSKAIEQLKILKVYEPDNEITNSKLEHLKKLITAIPAEDYAQSYEILETITKIGSKTEFSKLHELKDCCNKANYLVNQLYRDWSLKKVQPQFRGLSDADTAAAMAIHQEQPALFQQLESNYNRILEITKIEKPKLDGDNINIVYCLATHSIWEIGMANLERADMQTMRNLGISIVGPDNRLLPAWEILRNFKIDTVTLSDRTIKNAGFSQLDQGYLAGTTLQRFFNNYRFSFQAELLKAIRSQK